MKFNFENFGVIKKASFELGDLTVICGKNNTGKTFLLYALWGLLDNNEIFSDSRKKFIDTISKSELVKNLKNQLQSNVKATLNLEEQKEFFQNFFQSYFEDKAQKMPLYFNANPNFFDKTKIYFELESLRERSYREVFSHSLNFSYEIRKEPYDLGNSVWTITRSEIADLNVSENTLALLLYHSLRTLFDFPVPFFLSAQREAIHLFAGAISNYARTTLLKMGFAETNIPSVHYPLPIEANITYVAENWQRIAQQNSVFYSLNRKLMKEIEGFLGIKYKWIKNQLFVEVAKNEILPAHLASTSVRGLADLYFYIRHIADYRHLLIIDEPELSLHPENQIKLARLFVKLVNAGLKICIATHSDYIVKELNNCLMLSNEFEGKEKLMKKLGYQSNEILHPSQFRYYTAYFNKELNGCTLKPSPVDKLGISAESFNFVIEDIVNNSDEIINAIE